MDYACPDAPISVIQYSAADEPRMDQPRIKSYGLTVRCRCESPRTEMGADCFLASSVRL